ncbi:HAD family hydrolase [Streptomyces sp. NPDC002564]|uniref:HAD family hydrolase n=1 Tax=Streptomyces sp. NPDC002564 TaxID=3364649 RepID=UPI0036A0CB6C
MTSHRTSDGSTGRDVLAGLLRDARAVLFDFDGPVTRLFRGYPTAPVAEEIKSLLVEHGVTLPPAVRDSTDSHGLLQLLRTEVFSAAKPAPGDQKVLELAEGIVTDHEYRAAARALPEEHIASLLSGLDGRGRRLVIVSNNAAGPVTAYLERTSLAQLFEGVFGRDPRELRHMKPDPDCVRRALRHLALPARDCLLVGDQLTDLTAARAVGMPFLGYARTDAVAEAMRRRGADWAGTSLEPVARAASAASDPN